jgi:hypothetical protein
MVIPLRAIAAIALGGIPVYGEYNPWHERELVAQAPAADSDYRMIANWNQNFRKAPTTKQVAFARASTIGRAQISFQPTFASAYRPASDQAKAFVKATDRAMNSRGN